MEAANKIALFSDKHCGSMRALNTSIKLGLAERLEVQVSFSTSFAINPSLNSTEFIFVLSDFMSLLHC